MMHGGTWSPHLSFSLWSSESFTAQGPDPYLCQFIWSRALALYAALGYESYFNFSSDFGFTTVKKKIFKNRVIDEKQRCANMPHVMLCGQLL